MKTKRLARFLSVILFIALLPGLAMAQTPGKDRRRSLREREVTLRLELPSYEIVQDKEGFHIIRVEGFSPSGLPGDPWLPRKVYNVAVPPDALLDSLSLEVVDVQVERLPGPYHLKLASPDLTCQETEGDAGASRSGHRPALDTAPSDVVRLLAPGQMRKWRFARLEFTPFQYDAASGELSVASELTVRINYAPSPAAIDEALLRDRVMDDVAQQLLINYDTAEAWYQVTSGQENLAPRMPEQSQDEPGAVYDYVIITTNAIEAGSTKLASFISHKHGQGYSVLTITEDEYGGLTGQPPNGTAEKIRKWLQDNYIAYGIKYVLLIGDPDPGGDVPMKMCWPRHGAGSDEEAPTDYFFADLTGNWDLDSDQYYGEWGDDTGAGGVDFANEVYVGRIPVYSADYATLDNILQKIMDYENEPSPASWRESILLPMSFSTATYDGAPLAEQMMDDYLDAAGFGTWTQYQQGNGVCGPDSIYPSDEELRGGTVVRDRWAVNDYGLVLWWAHGSATSASVGYSGCWDGTLFDNTQTASLDDDHPSFTYQCSCTNGYPENNNNLQYAILKQGGIGTVSASRVSWFNTAVGYGDFDGSTTNSGIGYEYAKRLVEGQAASDALYNAKASMTPESNTRLMNFYDFNLYGDPSTGLYSTSSGGIKVAIYDHATTADISYWLGANMNSWSQYQAVLQNDPEGRFDVSIVTDLSAATLAGFGRLILPDNAVPDAYLSDVAAWFTPGRRIIAADSATTYAAYSGFMWPASAGSNGYGTYWNYGSSTDDQEVILAHKITEDYSVGDILSSISGDAQMFSGMLPADAEQITAKSVPVATAGDHSQIGPEVSLSPSEDVGKVTLSGPAVGTVGSDSPGGHSWVVVSPNPTAVSRPAGAVPTDGFFYLIGGEPQLGKVQRYDPNIDVWDDTLATMPTPGSNLCAAAIGDDIYVPGGYTGSAAIGDLQVYHTDSDTWEVVTTDPLPAARWGSACAAYYGKLYVIGGSDESTYHNNTWVYNPAAAAGSRWSTLANAPIVGSYGSALAVGNQIFWAGMRNTTADLADVYAYDPASDTWTTYPSLQTARGGAGMWAIGNSLLVGGGGWGSYLTSVEQYDTSLGTGGTWSDFGADLVQGRRTFGWATSPSQRRLFVAAGWAGAYLAEAEMLDNRMIYVASRNVAGHGTIVVLGPYQTSPGADVDELIRDAVEGPGIKVAIYDHFTTADISYWQGGNMNSWSQYQAVLQNDPERRFDVSIVTDLSAATLADFDRLILPDNAVPDVFLSDVAAWFTPGRRIIAADSATCYAAYSGFMWPASAGSNGYGTYWDYYSGYDDQEVILAHKITEDYSVGDILSSWSGDAQMYSGMLPADAEQITAKSTDHTMIYVASRDVAGHGTIVVLGPYQTSPGADVHELIRDAVEGAMANIEVSPTSFDVILNSGTSTVEQMTLSNTGDATLIFSIRDEGATCPSALVPGAIELIPQEQGSSRVSPTPSGGIEPISKGDGLPLSSPNPAGGIEVISIEEDVSLADTNLAAGAEQTGMRASYLYHGLFSGPSILLYTDDYAAGPGTTYVDQALQALGLSYTGYYGDHNGFGLALTGGTWDLVVVSHNNWFQLGNWWSEIEDYVNGGGKVVIATFDMDGSNSEPTTLWNTLGVSYYSNMSVPEPVYWWDAGHAIFNAPESVPQFSSLNDQYIDDGDHSDATSPTVAVGGFTASSSAHQAAISVGSSGIVNSFLICENDADSDSDSRNDAIELWENEILYMLGDDVTWLWETPASGTVGMSGSQVVDVHFDAAGMLAGSVHCANIIIHSNDHLHPTVSVPAKLTVNAPPTISGLPDVIVDETTILPVQIDLWAYASDAVTPVSELTFTIEGSPPSGAGVSIVGNRWLTVNPSASWCGYADVTVRVTDPGGLWDTDTFRVAVTWSCLGPIEPPSTPTTLDPISGGTLVYTDTQSNPTIIQVPAGAVTETITLVYTPVETATAPSGFAFAGHAFDLAAYRNEVLLSSFTFSVPVTVTIHYTDTDVAGLEEESLVLEYWNVSEDAWEDVACGGYDRHPDENWLSVPICHLSRFALFGVEPGAEEQHQLHLPVILKN